ncbi:MAG: hypothetical protein IK149_04470 [Oscillospiraceae bacterium]|nr:hypothetical protein [Oscillospiraceae bacterium]
MNRDGFFRLLSDLDDRLIEEAIRCAPEEASGAPERIVKMKKKRIITLVLAAALILALGVTAWATGFFSMLTRRPDPDETFRITWYDGPGGYVEWTDAKLAVTFPETAVSKEIQFRPGWLPEEMASMDRDNWRWRFTAEMLAGQGVYQDMSQPLQIQAYAMSQFNNGGALLLLYYRPDAISEDHWDEQGVDVLCFHGVNHLDAEPAFNVPERDLQQNFVVLANEEAGWVVTLSGEISLEDMMKVARNLEIRETGKMLSYGDFEDHYAFFDGGIG